MESVFRIAAVEQLPSNGVWKVTLLLTNDNDEDLQHLTEHTQKEMENVTPWYKLGYLMILMGDFDTAMDIHESLLAVITPDETKGLGDLFHQMGLIHEKKENYDSAYTYYCQALEFYTQALPPDDPRLAHAQTGIGFMLQEQGYVDLALEHFERALAIDLCTPQRNYQIIAERLSNIGMALLYQRKLAEGLAKFEEALELQLKHLPPTHAGLAITYNNISTVYAAQNDFVTALSYIEKTLFIEQKCHPIKHPSIAAAHFSVGLVLMGLKRYTDALEHTQQVLVIASQTFADDHPRMIQYREQLDILIAMEKIEKSD
jgi:Tfp pilus assembly protein PilF